MIKKLAAIIKGSNSTHKEAEKYRQLIRREAEIGCKLFGPIPQGHRREFFCLDRHTWVWHEEWTDKSGVYRVRTTRYDVRPDGILKAQDGHGYQPVTLEEADRLVEAATLYEQKIKSELYRAG